MHNMTDQVEDLLNAYAAQATEALEFHDFVKALKTAGISEQECDYATLIEEWLSDTLRVVLDDTEEDDEQYTPCQVLFDGCTFRVRPTVDELEKGILIPGHRFMPFGRQELMGFWCKLLDEDGVEVPQKVHRATVGDLAIYFSLLGELCTLDVLMMQSEKNAEELKQVESISEMADEAVDLVVYDLDAFYKRRSVQPGDMLTLTVKSWLNGVYQLAHTPAAVMDAEFEQCRKWVTRLRKELCMQFELLGPLITVYEQLLNAFNMGRDELLAYPGMHIGSILFSGSDIQLTQSGMGNALFWHAGSSPDLDLGELMEMYEAPQGTGRSDSLGAILRDMGLSLTTSEIEALMRDELYHDREQFQPVLERMFSGYDVIPFNGDRQEKTFFKLIGEMWARISKSYNRFADVTAGPCREKALALVERQVTWLRALDRSQVDPSQLPGQDMILFGKISAMLEHVLDTLSHPVPEKKMIADFLEGAERLEKMIEQLIENMDEHLRKDEPYLQILEDDDQEYDENEVECNVMLEVRFDLYDAKPPIWRRVQLPADMPLRYVHLLIQELFGWSGQQAYLLEYDGECMSKDVCIGHVLEVEGEMLDYTYDRQREWYVECKLVKIVERDENLNYPRCVAGRRAAPPEEVEGVEEYEVICNALLRGEWHSLPEALREVFPPDFDPAIFNKKALNQQLKEWSV